MVDSSDGLVLQQSSAGCVKLVVTLVHADVSQVTLVSFDSWQWHGPGSTQFIKVEKNCLKTG